MQDNSGRLLVDAALDPLERDMEKEDCIRALLEQLSAIQGNGMEYVLSNPRFQVLWRKACRIFEFYTGDMARCSASNIQAFQEMVQEKYPHLVEELLTSSGTQAVKDIQESAVARNNIILANDGSGEGFNMLHVGPVELLEMIGTSNIDTYTKNTAIFFSLLSHDMNAGGYRNHLNKYIAEQFTNEEDIKKLFRPMSSSYNRLSTYIDTRTTLVLLSRLKSWEGIFQRGLDWSTGIHLSSLVEEIPQEFLELIHSREDASEIGYLSGTIVALIGDQRTLEDTVFPVALTLLSMEEKERIEMEKKREYSFFDGRSTPTDEIRAILARRFPERYISTLEGQLSGDKDKGAQDQAHVNTLGDGNTRIAIASTHPERYIGVIQKLSDWEIFLALSTSVRDNRGREEKRVVDSLIQASLGAKVIDILLGLDVEQWRMRDMLRTLAKSNPQEFAQKVLDMEKQENRTKGNIYDNPLGFRDVLQTLILQGTGEKVLELFESQDYKDINIHTHALLYKHTRASYLEAAKRKGFDFEVVAREMLNGSDKPIDELVDYLAHYAFSGSAYHARDSYNEFLEYRRQNVEAITA